MVFIVSLIIDLKHECVCPPCEDHNPITFEAYLEDMGSYYLALAQIRGWGGGFYWNSQIFVEYRQKLRMAAKLPYATICGR